MGASGLYENKAGDDRFGCFSPTEEGMVTSLIKQSEQMYGRRIAKLGIAKTERELITLLNSISRSGWELATHMKGHCMIHPVTMNSRYRVGYGSERESYTVAKLMLRKQGAYGEVYFVCGGGECKEDALDTLGKGVLRIYLHYSFDVHHSGNYGVFQFDNQVLEA